MIKGIFRNKVLVQNFTSLSILQISNYIFPLVTFPYLVRVLGPEKFGLVNFAGAFVAYFGVLTDFGFNFSATREISINRNDQGRLEKIFNAVMIIKVILFILSFLIFISLLFLIPLFKHDYLLYTFAFAAVFGNLLFPIWFFQGLEQMKYITFLNVLTRLLITILIFVFIKEAAHYLLLVLLNSIGFFIVGISSLFIIRNKFKLKFINPGFEEIKFQISESWQLFISNVAINLYTISNTFILGLFTNNTVVGYFSAADKIRMAFQGIFSTMSQTVYPHVSLLFKQSVQEALSFIRKYFYLAGSGAFLAGLIIFIFPAEIVNFILGDEYSNSILVLRIISFLPFIIVLSNIAGIQTMLNLNMKKVFMRIIISASVINIILAFILVPFYNEIGTSVSMLVAEIFVTTSMIIYLVNKKVSFLKV